MSSSENEPLPSGRLARGTPGLDEVQGPLQGGEGVLTGVAHQSGRVSPRG